MSQQPSAIPENLLAYRQLLLDFVVNQVNESLKQSAPPSEVDNVGVRVLESDLATGILKFEYRKFGSCSTDCSSSNVTLKRFKDYVEASLLDPDDRPWTTHVEVDFPEQALENVQAAPCFFKRSDVAPGGRRSLDLGPTIR